MIPVLFGSTTLVPGRVGAALTLNVSDLSQMGLRTFHEEIESLIFEVVPQRNGRRAGRAPQRRERNAPAAPVPDLQARVPGEKEMRSQWDRRPKRSLEGGHRERCTRTSHDVAKVLWRTQPDSVRLALLGTQPTYVHDAEAEEAQLA